MNTRILQSLIALALIASVHQAAAQSTAFTYQGRLTSGTIAANGSYDLTFSLFSVSSGAGQVGSTYPAPATPVSNGLFTVTLDFGANFPGANRWLEISVRTNGGGAYTTLSPRQAITATPYAVFATTSGTASNLVNGSVVKSLNGLRDDVTLAAGTNMTITPNGNTLTFAAVGAGGSGIWSVLNNNAYYNAGNVGIGTAAPQMTLDITSPQHALAMTANGPDVTFKDTAHSNARDVIQSVNGDLNFFTESYMSGANPFSFLKVANNGNVGIGSSLPVGKLEVVAQDALRLVGYQPFLTILDSNAGYARSRIQGANGDILFYPESFIVGGAPAVTISSGSGNVGIGTTTPVAQLQAETGEVKPAVYGHATGAGTGVQGESSTGIGVYASSSSGNGVYATSATASGVEGHSGTGIGVYASSIGGRGVYATSDSGAGVESHSTSGFGVYGASTSAAGVEGHSVSGSGVYGGSTSAAGVEGHSSSGSGVYGGSTSGFGVFGESWAPDLSGVYGRTHAGGGSGVIGETRDAGSGGGTQRGSGVTGIANGTVGTGVHGIAVGGTDNAGFFDGWINVMGGMYVAGTKDFRIDHPLDPANKYLLHASIESPDVKNLYDGNITTDAGGEAVVTLPTYFEVLNRDFRYQLTVLGQFAQAIVSSEIKDNQFAIKTDKPNVKVSWQVTGIRQDAYMKAHPMVVEQDKPANERGTYQHPELFGQPEEKGLSWSQNPELWKRLKKERVEQAALPKP